MTMTLNVSNVGKSYGKRKVLDSISFSVRPAQIVGLLGPNGAGKSTLLNIICSLLKADHGQMTFNGQAYRDLPQPVTTVGTMLNPEWLDTRLSCHDLLLLHASRLHLPVPQRSTHTILKKVSLDESADRKVSQLSLGMRQRLALGLALLSNPDLLILDEPINGLDADGVAWMRDSLISFAQAGKTVLLSSHLMSEVEITASHVAVLNQGRIQKFDSLQNLQNSRATVFTTFRTPAASSPF
ncbi:BlsD [Parascardovia denticolens IPLA 20019]|nr:BlsD [Parascardovia denticolens IPLA 20019]